MIKQYYTLTKPGIIYGNLVTTVAAFLFAANWHFSVTLFFVLVMTAVGIGLVIASGCVFNNYIDRFIDAKMERTRTRALVTHVISVRNALTYGTILGIIGFLTLLLFVNVLTTLIAAVGFIFYVWFYSIAKRSSHWGAVVGSVSGAVPIVVGYTAVTGRLDLAALLLFLTLVAWQMPHFYAIALYRLDEYKAAGIPVLPAQKGSRATKIHIVAYIAAFTVVLVSFGASHLVNYLVLIPVLILAYVWLWLGIQGFKAPDEHKWARKTFLFSLVVLLSFCATITVAGVFK